MMIMLLLLLLPALVRSSDQPAPTRLIDYQECTTNVCFCKTTQGSTDLPIVIAATKPTDCIKTVGGINKFFTTNIALFQVNVIGDEAANLGDDPKIMFFDDTTPTFGCKRDKKTGKAELAIGNDPDIADKFKLSLFEDRSKFADREVVCAVLMELAFKFEPIADSQNLKLSFKNEKTYALASGSSLGKSFFKKHTSSSGDVIKCNPFSFKDPSLSSAFHVKPIKNRDSDHLNCDNYNNKEPGISYTMRYDNKQKNGEKIKKLLCKKETNLAWGYNLVTEGSDGAPDVEVPIPNPEAYTFYCAVPLNEMCTKPACADSGNQACPKFNEKPKTAGKPPTLECDGKKWVLDGKFYELAEQPTCQLDTDDADNGSAFIATLPGEDKEPYTITATDRCFTDYDCTAKSFLDIPSTDDEAAGGGIDKADAANVLRCVNQSREMRVTLGRDNLELNYTSYACNKKTGEWYNDTTIVPEGASVACLEKHVEEMQERKLNETEMIIYISIVFVCALVVLIVCSACIHIIRNKVRARQMKPGDLEKLEQKALIKKVNLKMDEIIAARPSTKALLIYGLDCVVTMVRNDTYDAKCWAKMYSYCVRLLSVISKMDTAVYHMINRFLFLQGKKIIDMRGWVAEKSVAAKSYAELMRVVAIRLLGFPMLDKFNDQEATQLLCDGFRLIGWHGGEQYPHAGVLWSVIGHARIHAFEDPPNSVGDKAAWWKRDSYLDTLRAITEGKYVTKGVQPPPQEPPKVVDTKKPQEPPKKDDKKPQEAGKGDAKKDSKEGAAPAGTPAAAAEPAPVVEIWRPLDLKTDLCGLPPMNDGRKWQPYVPPPRIKQSDLSKAETDTFLEYIRLCFDMKTVLGRRIIFDPNDLGAVCRRVIPYLASEQILIEDVPCGVTVVGDIHGQLHDLHRVFALAAKDGKPGWECTKYLFLGDYVDRGRQSVECLLALFCLKMLYPDRIFLLRGNHEFDDQNDHYGFAMELSDRYDDRTAKELYRAFNEVFGYMSLAAIIGGDKFFCAHAGISNIGMTRRRLNSMRKPILKADEDKYITDITWSDPAIALKGALFNSDRTNGLYFGVDSLAFALYTVDATALVRGHTVLNKGYEISMGGMCISLFSQSGSNNNNDAAVGVIGEDGIMKIVVLGFHAKRTLLDWRQRGKDAGLDDKTDAKPIPDNEKTVRAVNDVFGKQ